MTLKLYAHPFSSYCQKVLTALYENDTPFAYRMLGEERTDAELEALWPIKRFPVLVDDDRTIMEAIVIIEHLGLYHPGPVRLIPQDPKEALDVRLMDRFFDNYVMTPMQKIVFDCIRHGEGSRPLRRRRGASDARQGLWLARQDARRARMGGGSIVQRRRLRGGSVAVLCRLGPSGRRGLSTGSGLSTKTPRPPVLRAGRRRGSALPPFLPAGSAGS